nr:reverse transcriptase domain-containing protein [Tanacetum cinerariifolium]
VPNTLIKLMLFPFSLEGAARIWMEKEPRRSIFTWDDLVSKFINQFFPPSKTTNLQLHQLDTFYNALNSKDQDSLNSAAGGNFLDKMPRECLAIIASKSKVCELSPDIAELKDMVKALLLEKKSKNQYPAPVKVVGESCVTCGGAHSYRNCPTTDGNVYRDNIQDLSLKPPQLLQPRKYQLSSSDDVKSNSTSCASTSSSGTLPSNTIANLRNDLKAITTRSGLSYDGPQILPSTSFLPKVVEDEPDATKDTVQRINNGSTKDVQPQVVQSESPILTSEPVTCLIFEHVIAPIFKDMSFKISFVDALILMPKFASTLKALIKNKEKLSEMARTPLNEHCSAVLLKKLPKKLGDPGKFMIPGDFPGMAECLALADLGASINLMPFSVWKSLSLPDLTPTCMTLELADHSITRPVGVAEDVYVKVGSFHFSTNFVVVDFDADPRVPLILERLFLKTERALIDVFEGELTLRVGKEAITFNLDQTSRYSANYSDMTAKRIDIIGMACEEYSQEVLGFSDVIASGNPTSYYDPIVSTTSLTLTPFGNSDFLLKEVDAFLAIEDDPTSPEFYQPYLDREGDILLLEAFFNDDPSLPHPNQGNYLPEVRNELKICDDKLSVIIAKDLSVEEKAALITVLKSHKRAIAWKLSDIKGIDPEFYTHKILMEEDFEPAVQHLRRVNPKIHDVIKQEVIKLLAAGLIYPISNSHWVSPMHCVPKKGGFTVVKNEDNELIPTRLVTGWRACIDYRELNEATRKDHFPLSFMDQMLERLAGNQYYCFLDGFFGYFQIPIDPKDQEKTTFTCLYGTFAYRRMPFGYAMHQARFKGYSPRQKITKQGIEVDKAKVDVITKLPHPTTVKECVEAFQTLKIKLTEAPILIAPDWDMPFELMCDASDFAIGAVLGQRQNKHFRPIHYASKIMTEAESNYTTTEKEMLAVEFTFKVIDTKEAENLAADHLSQLENPHQNVLDPKEINESFPLEILNLVYTRGNQSTSWFADFANYHAGNFVVKGMSSQQKSKFVKDARKPLKFLRLATIDPQEVTMAQITQPRSGQVEVSNRGLKRILERAVAGDHKKVQINELNQLRDQAYENSLIYKEKTKRLHDSKIKNRVLNISDRVLLFNSRFKIFSGKLKSRWSGPAR